MEDVNFVLLVIKEKPTCSSDMPKMYCLRSIHTSVNVCVCVCVCVKLQHVYEDVASNAKNGFYTHSLRLMQRPHWHNVIILMQTHTQTQTLTLVWMDLKCIASLTSLNLVVVSSIITPLRMQLQCLVIHWRFSTL